MRESGPLRGCRVVELAGMGPGPFAGMTLAGLGADVVLVDRPGAERPFAKDPTADLMNRSKRSVALDLKDSDDVETLLALVATADVLVEGMRPGVAERLGLSPEVCLDRNPGLVYARMTGWGQDGPYAQTAGHDINYIAATGALGAIGPAGGPPTIPLNLVGNLGGGAMYLVVGVLAALRHRDNTGEGQVVDVAVVDGVVHQLTAVHSLMATNSWIDRRGSNLVDGGAPYYSVYESADDGYLAVGAIEPQFFDRLLDGLGIDPGTVDQQDRNAWPELRERIAGAFRSRPRAEWLQTFRGMDACVTPVLGLREAAEDEHVAARGSVELVGGVPHSRPTPHFSRTALVPYDPAPEVGKHSQEVLAEWLAGSRSRRADGARF